MKKLLQSVPALKSSLTRYVVPLVLLGVVTAVCGYFASNEYLSNADAVIYPYLFQDFSRHDLILPGNHANILKFPLFALQASLPYSYAAFTFVNAALLILCVIGTAVAGAAMLGKKRLPLICFLLALIIVCAQPLAYELSETVIRNIEYPLGMAFWIVIVRYAFSVKIGSSIERTLLVVFSLLFTITASGDSFMLVAFSLPLCAVLALLAVRYRKRRYIYGMLISIGTVVASMVLKRLVDVAGIADLSASSVVANHLIPLSHLAPSLLITGAHILSFFGVSPNTWASQPLIIPLQLFLCAILAGGTYGLVRGSVTSIRKIIASVADGRSVIIVIVTLSAICILAAYIGLDLVVTMGAGGALVDSGQRRYLTLLPLLIVFGFVTTRFAARGRLIVAVGLGCTLLAAAPIYNAYRTYADQSAAKVTTYQSIARVLNKAGVSQVVSGYWSGAPTRFWMPQETRIATVASCNAPSPTINVRRSWYKPSNGAAVSALIVDRSWYDANYWSTCDDTHISHLYGEPAYTKTVTSPIGSPITLWIYDYDIREKIAQ